MPTSAHIVYIPFVLLFGIVLGYVLAQQLQKDTKRPKPPTQQA